MRALLALAIAATGCKTREAPNPAAGEQPTAAPAKVAGCRDDYAELVKWADELVVFKNGYDAKYGKRDAELPGVARIEVRDAETWGQVVASIDRARKGGVAQVGFVVHDRAQVARGPALSAIHQRLVDLANRDDTPIDQKDGPLLAEVFARCEPVKAGLGKLAGASEAERFASFVGLVKAGLARCRCDADLAAASELVWARARLSPLVDRLLVFGLAAPGAAGARKVEYAAATPWSEIRTPLAQLALDLGEAAKTTPVAFAVAP